MTDKERDDALIAEAEFRALQRFRKDLVKNGTYPQLVGQEALRLARENWQPAPKPDRAEVLFDDLYGKTKDEQIDCFRRHFDELRAEWDAERPAVVVPEDVAEASRIIYGHFPRIGNASAHILADFIKSLDGAKGGE